VIWRFLYVLRFEVNPLAFRQYAGGARRISDHFVKIEFADLKRKLVHVDTSERKHFLHDTTQTTRLLLNHAQGLAIFRFGPLGSVTTTIDDKPLVPAAN